MLRRIEYVIDKSQAARAMMGHPRVLAAVEQLAGADLFPTQDAMVLKMPGQGIAVPWHRDRASTDDYPVEPPVFIADFYLDDADLDTCIWVVPGSHRWSDARTAAAIAERNQDGFSTRGAEPMPLRAGDVLFHNVRLLHGSLPNASAKLRRVVYYTFHTVHIEWEHGPFNHEYIIAKQKVLRACIRERGTMPTPPPKPASTTGRPRPTTRAHWPKARPPRRSATPPPNTRSLSSHRRCSRRPAWTAAYGVSCADE